MIPFPCKENKCILYPACRHKISIVCNELAKYYHHQTLRIPNEIKSYQTIWKDINNHIPKAMKIQSTDKLFLFTHYARGKL